MHKLKVQLNQNLGIYPVQGTWSAKIAILTVKECHTD